MFIWNWTPLVKICTQVSLSNVPFYFNSNFGIEQLFKVQNVQRTQSILLRKLFLLNFVNKWSWCSQSILFGSTICSINQFQIVWSHHQEFAVTYNLSENQQRITRSNFNPGIILNSLTICNLAEASNIDSATNSGHNLSNIHTPSTIATTQCE